MFLKVKAPKENIKIFIALNFFISCVSLPS